MPSGSSAVPGKSFVHSHSCPAPTSMGPNQVKRTRLELVDLVRPYTQQPCHPPLYAMAQWAHKPHQTCASMATVTFADRSSKSRHGDHSCLAPSLPDSKHPPHFSPAPGFPGPSVFGATSAPSPSPGTGPAFVSPSSGKKPHALIAKNPDAPVKVSLCENSRCNSVPLQPKPNISRPDPLAA